jgi:hypothetical protein
MDWNPVGAGVFAVVFVSLSLLVYTGKLPPASLGVLLTWLVPSPVSRATP